MKRFAKWVGIGFGGFVVLLIAAFAVIYLASSSRINKLHQIALLDVAIHSDSSAIERGHHAARIRGCTDCHGEDYGGGVFLDDPAMGRLIATNLTAGEGGIGRDYTDADWVRAIRHGVGPEGRALLFMPSYEYYPMSDEDLGSMIAYLKSLQPVDRQLPASKVGPMGRALLLAGQFPLLPAEMIDHDAPRSAPPAVGPTVEYGAYLAATCTGCHGPNYSGGKIPGTPPVFPAAANITPHESGILGWTKADFVAAVQEGKARDGRTFEPQFMPWPNFRHMTDVEIEALWQYIQTLPPREYGNR